MKQLTTKEIHELLIGARIKINDGPSFCSISPLFHQSLSFHFTRVKNNQFILDIIYWPFPYEYGMEKVRLLNDYFGRISQLYEDDEKYSELVEIIKQIKY